MYLFLFVPPIAPNDRNKLDTERWARNDVITMMAAPLTSPASFFPGATLPGVIDGRRDSDYFNIIMDKKALVMLW
jgi:hypothetical protein